MSYFERTGPSSFRATDLTRGAWDPDDQHVAPSLGLLAHLVEADRDRRRDDGLVVSRLSYDILGTMPVADLDAQVRVERAGRTIELVEASLAHAGRVAVRLRAWLLQPQDTAAIAATPLERIDPPEAMEPFDPNALWPEGFIGSEEIRRREREPGRASYWVRTDVPLLDSEETTTLARFAGLLDIANGMAVRADPHEVAFPNVDLTAHFLTEPQGDWLGFDTSVSFGPAGVGVTSSVLHDSTGPIGTLAQSLTVRPR